ncbi:MAG: hypothetical protein IKC73_01645 [Clostridia bacterium]|nr:hypothetical protein [Clostridia bacterium]
MELEKLLEEFGEWLAERDIDGVEVSDGLGATEDITALTFPIPSDEGYLPFDIIATFEDESAFFYVDYCDIPDVDELALYRFVNDLNKTCSLTVSIEDDRLCFGYSLPMDFLTDGTKLAAAFLLVLDAIDEIREDVREAFGMESLADEDESYESEEEEEDEYLEEPLDEEYDEEEISDEEGE